MLLKARRWSAAGTALLVTGALSACAATERPVDAANSGAAPTPQCANGKAYARTELFMGKSIPGGGTVTDAAFAEFLDREVTPRFPEGFTVIPAMGQYREANGVIDHEASDMVIFFYPQGLSKRREQENRRDMHRLYQGLPPGSGPAGRTTRLRGVQMSPAVAMLYGVPLVPNDPGGLTHRWQRLRLAQHRPRHHPCLPRSPRGVPRQAGLRRPRLRRQGRLQHL
jgi:hypothetical protein